MRAECLSPTTKPAHAAPDSKMPMPGNHPETQIQCKCGEILDLTGAKPGRIGRCPSCGRRFQVGQTESHEPEPQSRSAHSAESESDSDGAGYDLGPEQVVQRSKSPGFTGLPSAPESSSEAEGRPSGRTEKGTRDRDAWRADAPRKKPKLADAEQAPSEAAPTAMPHAGLLPVPQEMESSAWGSLAYPLWDMPGITCLLLIAPIMAVLSLIVLGAMPLVNQGGEMLVVGPITFGFAIVFALGLGFLFEVFEAVLVSSAQGEIYHPRWPDLEFGAAVRTLVRWGIAWVPPLALVWYVLRGSDLIGSGETLAGRLMLAGLCSVVGGISLVSLLAMALHDDIGAALPQTVLPAIFRMGTRLLGPVGYLALTVILAVLAHALLAWLGLTRGILPLLLAAWLSWILLLYAGLVLMRALGCAFFSRRKEIGWFYREPKRVEVATEPPPLVEPSENVAPTTTLPRGTDPEPIPVEDDGLGDW